mmetsp:Transcript_32467/g.67848  ORF Transcript_32467/g.67848 Transcript_32467/m.67848 type:complete len:82 (-) Transcript_32467:81-326(-)
MVRIQRLRSARAFSKSSSFRFTVTTVRFSDEEEETDRDDELVTCCFGGFVPSLFTGVVMVPIDPRSEDAIDADAEDAMGGL